MILAGGDALRYFAVGLVAGGSLVSAGPGPPAVAGPSSAEGGKSCSYQTTDWPVTSVKISDAFRASAVDFGEYFVKKWEDDNKSMSMQ